MFGGIVSSDTDNKSSYNSSITIKTVTLDHLLKELNSPTEIDYLSIDIEGAEERVLKKFPFNKYSFKCITIERPTEFIRSILQENGYVLIKEIPGFDCFYINQLFINQYLTNIFSFYKKKYLAICMG